MQHIKKKQMKKVMRKRGEKKKKELRRSAQWLQYQWRSQYQTSPRSLIANR